MKIGRTILACVVAVAISRTAARADYVSGTPAPAVAVVAVDVPLTGAADADDAASGVRSAAPSPWRDADEGHVPITAGSASETGVRQLPPAPSSAALFLSAMLSVGAYRAIKHARLVEVGSLPDWYHSDAPAQVGHAFACELQFAPVVACVFDTPAAAPPVIDWSSFRATRAPCRGLTDSLLARIPRAPPVLHAC